MHPLIAIPAITALVYRAYSRQSLTPLGILVALLTAIIHALHPWSIFFVLLCTFFLAGTFVTKVHHAEKTRLTLSSAGSPSGEGPRTHVQVLANSVCASVLVLMHLWVMRYGDKKGKQERAECWDKADLIPWGIVANYAAVTADTFSSELGILARSQPRLVTSWTFRKVPPGTNGGVTGTGLGAGFLGAAIIGVISVGLMPFCADSSESAIKRKVFGRDHDGVWTLKEKALLVAGVTVWGGLGSVLDSFLGGWLQASVVDRKTGKVVEGQGGRKVLVHASKGVDGEDSRSVESGLGLLDNNAVNFMMAGIMSVVGMSVMGWAMGIAEGSTLR